MAIQLRVVGQKPPNWVKTAFDDYSKRMPQPYRLQCTEINTAKHLPNKAARQQHEAKQLLKNIPTNATVVILDENGKSYTSPQLAKTCLEWQQASSLYLLVGGPDGFDACVKERAQYQWSLSALTLPHHMVRVIVAEQWYRAWTIQQNHPYHRA